MVLYFVRGGTKEVLNLIVVMISLEKAPNLDERITIFGLEYE